MNDTTVTRAHDEESALVNVFASLRAEEHAWANVFIGVCAEENAGATVEERRFQRRVRRTKSWASAPVDRPAPLKTMPPFPSRMNSGISHARNERTPICTNLQWDRAPTLPPNPPNRTPWNERLTLCI